MKLTLASLFALGAFVSTAAAQCAVHPGSNFPNGRIFCCQRFDFDGQLGTLKQKFVIYWIDSLRGDAYKAKCKAIDSETPPAPVTVNWVTMEPPPPPKSELLSSHPIFSVFVTTGIQDPHGSYNKVFAQLSQADSTNKEKIFHVIWDATFELGRKCRYLAGQSEVYKEHVEEVKKLGLKMGMMKFEEEQKQRERNHCSVAIDTSELHPSVVTSARIEAASQTEPMVTSVLDNKLNWADESDTIPPAVLIPPTSPP
ncbi:hypothetical protein D9758_012521 [Tetrapyrgos nigripes]|uniref:Uncharacterized protein n=1 Tax=Tetrapyrgos nigripes TaxID=182062 RepID=A0A8H5G328_9AGAR|nr:hypothetical protein D9758_012521 [Tetrapyrgos nigripes]